MERDVKGQLDDLIFANRKLDAIQLLRQQRNLGVAAATEALSCRYRELRANSPERFTCTDEDYWRGFKS